MYQITEPATPFVAHRAIGIDLGTTNSVVAYAQEGVAHLIPIEGRVLTPSAVQLGAVSIVGHKALKAQQAGAQVITSSKRWMGEETSPVSPVEIAARILKYVKEEAERFLGYKVESAVITVPAYFTEAARAATRDAARIAGLHVLRLISEPTAAALAYHLDEAREGLYLVYDLGGGTFDVSLLRMTMGVFQVLAVGGDTHLGGDDVDALLAEHLGMTKATASDMLTARTVKEHLSQGIEWRGRVGDQEKVVTRDDFDRLVAPLVKRTLDIVRRTLRDGQVAVEEINEMIVVGGATRMPVLQRALSEFLGRPPLMSLDPDHVVAMGAALQAEALSRGSETLLLDVTPLSLGIETMGGVVAKLITRNAPLPTSVMEEFTTSHDGQVSLKIHVVQGETEQVETCRSLGHFVLRDLTPLPAGELRVQVTFALDADGLLSVTAQEKGSPLSQVLHIKPAYGLDEEQLQALLKKGLS